MHSTTALCAVLVTAAIAPTLAVRALGPFSWSTRHSLLFYSVGGTKDVEGPQNSIAHSPVLSWPKADHKRRWTPVIPSAPPILACKCNCKRQNQVPIAQAEANSLSQLVFTSPAPSKATQNTTALIFRNAFKRDADANVKALAYSAAGSDLTEAKESLNLEAQSLIRKPTRHSDCVNFGEPPHRIGKQHRGCYRSQSEEGSRGRR
ncbi:hypothetical protein EDD16DRAFT_1519608 [Pisolithus croceorrhizus]|nr:hypothetical protein EV401DRAFT_1890204 [Pisolithus croceorrhizus]KAI6119057.1 hypothetical protein EDD16DRAFT_1519608 [Pisolithus croceorrhizus]